MQKQFAFAHHFQPLMQVLKALGNEVSTNGRTASSDNVKDKAACLRWERKSLAIFRKEENKDTTGFEVILPAA